MYMTKNANIISDVKRRKYDMEAAYGYIYYKGSNKKS